ncbi:MAG: hypothetical protein V1777_04805 [Candidatus Micrarchaeota archaeon]
MVPKTWVQGVAIAFLVMAFMTVIHEWLQTPFDLRVWITLLVGIVVFVAGFLLLEQNSVRDLPAFRKS